MADPYLGEIRLFCGNYAPQGWAFCQGQLLPISQNTALFSLLGTMYGGDGKTTFALPDLRGRVPINQGAGNGLSPRSNGEMDGSNTVTLITAEMPAHTHQAVAVDTAGNQATPSANVWSESVGQGRGGQQTPLFAQTVNTQMSPMALAVAGGSQPHNNMQPYMGMNYIIALSGIFPPRP